MEELRNMIREVPDFPKPGINFYDITTLLKDPKGLRRTLNHMTGHYNDTDIDTIIGIESRGFIFAVPMAQHLGTGFVPVRKPGKLPHVTASATYELEYGTDTLEIHRDAIGDGHKVLIVDDLLATGGTAKACADLVKEVGGDIVGLAFLCELTFLGGREKLDGYDVHSLIKYDD
ncbi:MAG: adenine phosphoribosyltransferase [Acidobacteriota bacterium]|nr:adenine phosphoribosyltransferase [Acidobacteriota bacterium]MDH3529863.1 adenine phosphoribosyltransferase [Acidobacteriota bacterium]